MPAPRCPPDPFAFMTDDEIIQSIRMYRESVVQTQAVYIEAGELIRGSYGWLSGGDDVDSGFRSRVRRFANERSSSRFLDEGVRRSRSGCEFPNDVPASTRTCSARTYLGQKRDGHPVEGSGRLVDRYGKRFEIGKKSFDPLPKSQRFEIDSVCLQSLALRMAKLFAAADGTLDGRDNQALADLDDNL